MAEAAAAPSNISSARPPRDRFLDQFRGQTVRTPLSLGPNSPVRRIYRRTFVAFSAALFFTRYYLDRAVALRLPDAQRKSDATKALVEALLADTKARLDTKVVGLTALLERHGTQHAYIDKAEPLQATIVDPWAKRVVQMIQSAEAVVRLVDALWLDALMNDGQRAAAVTEVRHILGQCQHILVQTSHATRTQMRALDEPTPGNVAAYYALQRVMLDKASRFTEMAGQVSVSEPMLDENLLRPTASFGGLAMDDRAVRATDAAARKLAAMAGLWFVYESACPFCEKQAGPLKGLANAHGFKILPIALDGLPLPGNPFPDFVPDRGQARRLGADTTPALFLVRPGPGGGVLPLGQGLLSGDEIVRRAIALARQKGWLDERDYQDTRRARSLLVDEDLGKQLDPATLDDPERLTRLVRENLREKLRHPIPSRDRHD